MQPFIPEHSNRCRVCSIDTGGWIKTRKVDLTRHSSVRSKQASVIGTSSSSIQAWCSCFCFYVF